MAETEQNVASFSPEVGGNQNLQNPSGRTVFTGKGAFGNDSTTVYCKRFRFFLSW